NAASRVAPRSATRSRRAPHHARLSAPAETRDPGPLAVLTVATGRESSPSRAHAWQHWLVWAVLGLLLLVAPPAAGFLAQRRRRGSGPSAGRLVAEAPRVEVGEGAAPMMFSPDRSLEGDSAGPDLESTKNPRCASVAVRSRPAPLGAPGRL